MHLTGAPYHPATNGSAERLVQTFKQALRKSNLPPRRALQEFLMQYRRTPNSSGYSPSELLNSRQIRTKIDILLPSPAHTAQGKQAKEAAKSQCQETVAKVVSHYNVGDPVYARYFGPRRDQEPRWVPAVVTKQKGTRTVNVRVYPRGPVWRRHIEQLKPRYASEEDTEPGDAPWPTTSPSATDTTPSSRAFERKPQLKVRQEPYEESKGTQLVLSPECGRTIPRRSRRISKPPTRYTPEW